MICLIFFVLALYFYGNNRISFGVIFFCFVTNFFQIIPVEIIKFGFPYIDKPSDYGLLLIALIPIISNKRYYTIGNLHDYKPFFIYFFIIFIVFILTFLNFQYSLSESFRGFRNNIFLFSFLLFWDFKFEELKKIALIILKITIFCSALYVLQPFIQYQLLQTVSGDELVNVLKNDETGILRFYNNPVYVYFALFTLLHFKEIKLKNSKIYISIVFLCIIFQLHRSHIIAILIVLALNYFKLHFRNLIKGLTFCIIVFLVFNLVFPSIFERLNGSRSDLELILSNSSIGTLDASDNTASFRLMMLLERVTFILSKPFTSFFGIGYIAEDTSFVDKLPLFVGNYTETLGRIKKVETSDIVYASLVLRTGFIGFFGFVFFYFNIVFSLIKLYTKQLFSRIIILMIGLFFLLSFTSYELISFKIIALLSFLFASVIVQSKESNYEQC